MAVGAGADCAAALRGLGEVSCSRDDGIAAGRLFEEALDKARGAVGHREVADDVAVLRDRPGQEDLDAARNAGETEAVRKCVRRIFLKLGIHSRVELARSWPRESN